MLKNPAYLGCELGTPDMEGFVDGWLLGFVDVLGRSLGCEVGQSDTDGCCDGCELGAPDKEGFSDG